LISLKVLISLHPGGLREQKIAFPMTGKAGIFSFFMPFLCVQIKGIKGRSRGGFPLNKYKKSFPNFLDQYPGKGRTFHGSC
jgi:hypothetical protein